MSEAWLQQVEQLVANVCQQHGCYLYDIEFVGLGKGRTLRVFIDSEQGAGIDECSHVATSLNEHPELDKIVPGESYNLEVSTPGLDRELKKPWHFEKVIGKKIYVKTRKPLEAMGVEDKKWKAAKTVETVLEAADGEGILFKPKECEIRIPYQEIDKAKLVFEIVKGQKK
ncbi:MAG: ribosome maturation factor RimP [Bdellovibrionia bacterium]